MISGQWFQVKRSNNWQNIEQNHPKFDEKYGQHPDFNKLGRVPPKKHSHKI